jgi:hypothetical protein
MNERLWPVLALLLAASSAWAQGPPPCPEFQVNTYTTGSQYSAAVASDAAGNFVVTWLSYGPFGTISGVVARRFSAGGQPLGPELQVNNDTINGDGSPRVASDASGNFVVVWESAGDGSYAGIFARRFTAGGVPLGPQFQVNTYTPDQQAFPAVASDPSGNFVVVWESTGQDGDDRGVFARLFDSSGAPRGAEFQVNTYTTGPQGEAAVAMDAAGNFVVAWDSVFHEVGDTLGEIIARRFTASGAPRGGEFRVNTLTLAEQLAPAVASDADGNFVVAWDDDQGGVTFDVLGRWYDAAGVPRAPERLINAYTTGYQVRPAVIASGGDIVIVWNSLDQDGSADGIFGRRFDGLGAAIGPEFQVNLYTPNSQVGPAIAPGPGRGFVAAWFSEEQDGSGYGIFASLECARLYTVAPCRLADTRNPSGPSGGPALSANATRAFPVSGLCNIPPDARAVAVNVTAVGATAAGDLRLFPAGETLPLASAVNFVPGRARAGNAVVPLGLGGEVAVRCDMSAAGSTHVVLDAYGYFKR